jgi:DNA-binding Lrp family transcriptional regulator
LSDISIINQDPVSDSKLALSPIDKKLIFLLSGDLGSSQRPYLELAQKLGLTEERVLEMIESYRKDGLIRRLGAVVVHQRSGFKANAMVVWEVAESDLDLVGLTLAGLPYVSHCYFRPPLEDWPFNLYTMIHAQNDIELKQMITKMEAISKPISWQVLESVKELKKTSLTYFYDSL